MYAYTSGYLKHIRLAFVIRIDLITFTIPLVTQNDQSSSINI